MSASEVLVSSRIVSIRPALVALVISLAVGPPRVLVFVVVINCIILYIDYAVFEYVLFDNIMRT